MSSNVLIPNKLLISAFSNKEIKLTSRDIDFLLILSKYAKAADSGSWMEINKKEILDAFNKTQTRKYKDLREALIRIQSFVFNISNDQLKKGDYVNIFKHKNNVDSSTIKIKFDIDMRALLTQLDGGNFATLNLQNILAFKSIYTKRLYMILSTLPSPGQKFYSIIQLREMLDLKSSYSDNSNLLRRAILPAQAELLQTDRAFQFHLKKTGKKITGILFDLLKGESAPEIIRTGRALELWANVPAKINGAVSKAESICRSSLRAQNMNEKNIESALESLSKKDLIMFYSIHPGLLIYYYKIVYGFATEEKLFDSVKAQKLIERVPELELVNECNRILKEIQKDKAKQRTIKIKNYSKFAYSELARKFTKETLDA